MDIEEIRSLCSDNKIYWKLHSLERMMERNISKEDVINCINNGKIIEKYPDERAFPSCLIFGIDLKDRKLHVVAGITDDKLHIITVYFPDMIHFEADFVTRKRK